MYFLKKNREAGTLKIVYNYKIFYSAIPEKYVHVCLYSLFVLNSSKNILFW